MAPIDSNRIQSHLSDLAGQASLAFPFGSRLLTKALSARALWISYSRMEFTSQNHVDAVSVCLFIFIVLGIKLRDLGMLKNLN